MSEIKVNKISPATSTDITLGDSGDTFTVPSGATIVNSGTATGFGGGGKLLQAVIGYKIDSENVGGTADSWTDLSGLTVTTATLASSSSRVLVMANVHMVGDDHIAFKIVTGDGSDITNFIGEADGSRTRATSGTAYRASDDMNYCFNGTGIASPGVTTAQTYKVQWRCANTGVVYINSRNNSSTSVDDFNLMSSITAIEIGA